MKITFEGLEATFSMGAVSIDLDPKETEIIINADVRKHEISEGDTTEQIRKCIYSVVKDAVGSAMAKQQPKQVPEDKPKPEPPAAGAAAIPNPEPPTPTAGAASACMELQPVPEKVAAMERSPEPVELVDPEEEAPRPKKFGPKRRAAAK